MTSFPASLTPSGDNNPATSFALYTRFKTTATISVTTIRFYAPAHMVGAVGSLYSGSTLLGQSSATSVDEGWNVLTLASPVSCTAAGGQYDAEVYLPDPGHFALVSAASPLTEGVVYQDSGATWGYREAPSGPTAFVTTGGLTSNNFYGVGIDYTGLGKIAHTETKVDTTHVNVAWDTGDASITNGVTILRGPGTLSTDGNGKTPSDAAYDPTTISGVSVRASAQTSSPYIDTLPSAGTYTYWVARTS